MLKISPRNTAVTRTAYYCRHSPPHKLSLVPLAQTLSKLGKNQSWQLKVDMSIPNITQSLPKWTISCKCLILNGTSLNFGSDFWTAVAPIQQCIRMNLVTTYHISYVSFWYLLFSGNLNCHTNIPSKHDTVCKWRICAKTILRQGSSLRKSWKNHRN